MKTHLYTNNTHACFRWKEKSALCRSDTERAWLYHEIGYCHLSKREYARAKQFGEMAYASAEHTGDMIWQLNASTLIAQAEARMTDYQNSYDTFKYALDLAKLIGNSIMKVLLKKYMLICYIEYIDRQCNL